MGTSFPAMTVKFGGSIEIHNHHTAPHNIYRTSTNAAIGYVAQHGGSPNPITISLAGWPKGNHAIKCVIHTGMTGTITIN
jgi:plastocyanin